MTSKSNVSFSSATVFLGGCTKVEVIKRANRMAGSFHLVKLIPATHTFAPTSTAIATAWLGYQVTAVLG